MPLPHIEGQDSMQVHQRQRTDATDRRMRELHARRPGGPLGDLHDRLVGKSQGVEGDLLGLKAIGAIFSHWDSHIHRNWLGGGRSSTVKKEANCPWWTDQGDSTQFGFGDATRTAMVSVAMNAGFESLCRLNHVAGIHSSHMVEQATRLAALEAQERAQRAQGEEACRQARAEEVEYREGVAAQFVDLVEGLRLADERSGQRLRDVERRMDGDLARLSGQQEADRVRALEAERALGEEWVEHRRQQAALVNRVVRGEYLRVEAACERLGQRLEQHVGDVRAMHRGQARDADLRLDDALAGVGLRLEALEGRVEALLTQQAILRPWMAAGPSPDPDRGADRGARYFGEASPRAGEDGDQAEDDEAPVDVGSV